MPARRRTLGDVLGGDRDAFGFLRWLLAVLVVLDHSIAIGGFDAELDLVGRWSEGRNSLGGVAVSSFFVISGLLVTQSRLVARGTIAFLWRRVLRIFPGYWVCLLVTAFVLAPLAWGHEHGRFGGYLSADPSPVGYPLENAALAQHQPGIGGLLAGLPTGRVWNGSLWTLKYEFACYLVLALLAALGLVARRWPLLVLAGAGWLVLVVRAVDQQSALDLFGARIGGGFIAPFVLLFFGAGALACWRDRVPIDDRAGVLAVLLFVLTLRTDLTLPVGAPALGYAVVWLAARLPMRRWGRRADLSYGTYIYAFPLQVLLAEYGLARHGALVFVLASVALVSALAALSWFAIEGRALRLKRRGPGSMARW